MKIMFGIKRNYSSNSNDEYIEKGEKYTEFFRQFPEIEVAKQYLYADNPKWNSYFWYIDTQDIRKFKILNLQKELTDSQKELVRLLGDESKIVMNVAVSGTSGTAGTTGSSGSSGTDGSSGTSGSSGIDPNLKAKIETKPLPVVETKPLGTVKIVEPVEVVVGNPFLEILAEME